MSTAQEHGSIPGTAGSLEYQIDGQPAKVGKAGQALTIPAGVIHAVRNAGTGTALAADIVERASRS